MTIVAALLAVAVIVAATPQGKILGETFSYAVCQVVTAGQGPCEAPSTSPEAHKPEDPCVVTQDGIEANAEVAVLFFTTSDGRRVEVQKLSNGEYRVTVSQSASGGVEAGVGGGITVSVGDDEYGGSATAEASASLDIKDGDVYYTDQDGIQGLLDAITADQVKDVAVGDGGPIRWGIDQLSDLTGVGESDLPDPDETFAEGGVSLNASAEATGLTTSASAGIGEAVALGVRKNRDGTTTVYLKASVEGEAGYESLSVGTDGGIGRNGAGLEGKVEVLEAITFDSEGNMVRYQSTAVAQGEASGLAAAIFNGQLDGSGDNQASGYRIYQSTLDIESDADEQVVADHLLALGIAGVNGWVPPGLPGAPGTAGNFYEVARDRGTVTQTDYDADSSTYGVKAEGELGVELGAGVDVQTDSLSVTGAQYWDGTQWVDWEECAA
ncbi:hypothetical protein [Nocardioides sp. MH1]|uniref:hypothetical protein n=1 Tax=Nocardioides sp. MH1 TaxID=3242490 RepID=UPI0035225DF2